MGWPIVIVPIGGLPVTESSTGIGLPVSVTTDGFGIAVTVVSSGGLPVIGSQVIQLSAATVADTATVGTTIGTLSVLNGTGSYTFTFTSNPGTLFAISGSNLNVAAALSAGSDAITIHADNGAGSVLNTAFLITVTHAGSAAALKFNLASNSQYLPLTAGI
jgi:hypothetical protein